MNAADPQVARFIGRAMVARIATLSRSGRPSITPLYFVYTRGRICFGTASWTLAAREVQADPRVALLFQIEGRTDDRRVLRVTGRAAVRLDAGALRENNLGMALKYILRPGALLNRARHWRLQRAVSRYHARNAEKGPPCVIEVTPDAVEFLDALG